MNSAFELRIPAKEVPDGDALETAIRERLGLRRNQGFVELEKKALDARGRTIQWIVRGRVHDRLPGPVPSLPVANVSNSPEVFIIGCGPAGLFAALELIRRGLKPVILERGKDVRRRRRDIARLTRQHIVNPDSNYCFGEGGAGTFSDGKLYTRSDKRGDVKACLQMLIAFGAPPDILYEARPHIGTNRLPVIIENMRHYIRDCGGTVLFDTRLTGFEIHFGAVHALHTTQGRLQAERVILATGHSASDIYRMLKAQGIPMQAKPYSVGFRVEHPQALVDQWQYHCAVRPSYLPPAYYNVSFRADERGVYSFCMCPGGIIAPCATSPGEVVTNGWSPSRRNNPLANAGFVAEVNQQDFADAGFDPQDPLCGLYYREALEQSACTLAGGRQSAPAQRAADFLASKASASLPATSYVPGAVSINLWELFPRSLARRLAAGLRQAEKRMRGFAGEDALLVAPETRTSAPVRIIRDPHTLQSPAVTGLYPCGEGAGFAGGIISAALDGIRCAGAVGINSRPLKTM